MDQPKILVTGATGFVGGAVAERLRFDCSFSLSVAVRHWSGPVPDAMEIHQLGSLSESSWDGVVDSVDTVIHCAARVHVMNDRSADPLVEFREVNVGGTLNLAKRAAHAGVRRFIFISSIKVNGEHTAPGAPYSASDRPQPLDAYGISKMEAEQGLRALASETGMEVVIIRPVLVYGPGVKANFRSMMNWLNKGIPLPLGAIRNKRSLVALDNLVDLIVTCVDHPGAANQTFLVSDGEDLSTSELLQRMGRALGRPARLLPVPVAILHSGAALLGKREVAQRLCGSLQVDIGKTRELLQWAPPVGVDEAMARTAKAFLRG